jgi:DNA repair protein RadC
MSPTETAIESLVALGCMPKVAATIVERCGADLRQLTVGEMLAAGCAPTKADKVYRAMMAARALTLRAADSVQALGSAVDAFDLLRGRIGHEMREHFVVVSVNVRNQVIAVDVVAIGSVAGVEVHPREIFRAAIRAGAAGVVLAHNHPSGDPTPSAEDVSITKRLRECGALMGIPVLDHVVVCDNGYRSIAEHMGSSF